jgi:hypothetical protein
MLPIVFVISILLTSCSAPALAQQSSNCGVAGASFTLCASKSNTQKTKEVTPAKTTLTKPKTLAKPKPPATKTITPAKAKKVVNPTSCQEIWNIKDASAGCSKPKAVKQNPKQSTPVKSVAVAKTSTQEVVTTLEDQASSLAPSPIAIWFPGGDLITGDVAQFEVLAPEQIASVEIFDEPASIRFVATSATWQIDSETFFGFRVSRGFSNAGNYQALAQVSYRVDYQLPGEQWVLGAGEITMESNPVVVRVIEPLRRTLLVG